MRRYKLAVYIIVILSVFNFVPVLAAPIAEREVCEACADLANEGKGVIIWSWKRGEERENMPSEHPGWRQVPSNSESLATTPLSSLSPSAPEEASWLHQEYNWEPNTEIVPASPSPDESPSNVPPQEEITTEQPKPQPKSDWSKLVSKSKSLWRKVVRISKSLFSEMFHPNLQIRISDTESGAVNDT